MNGRLCNLHRIGRAQLRCCQADQRGTAAIEFALLCSLFFMVVWVGLDFGSLFLERSKMNEAVSAAAINAFGNADNVNFAGMPGYVRALADNQTLSVTTSCNGVAGSCANATRTCACLRQDGSYASAACGTACTGAGVTANSTAGYYFTLSATQTFQPALLPHGLLDNAQITQSATVRLQ